MASDAQLVVDSRNGTGESPVWHVGEQALYWVDIPARRLCRWLAADAAVTTWEAPEMLACIALGAAPGHWVAGLESGVFELQTQPSCDVSIGCSPGRVWETVVLDASELTEGTTR